MHSLPTIGNDLIDLQDPACKDKFANPRFLKRICQEEECRVISQSINPHLMLWTLWACKEAAYKALSKQEPIPFIPPHWICEQIDEKHWCCSYQGKQTIIRMVLDSPDYLHAIGVVEGDKKAFRFIVDRVFVMPLGTSESSYVRQQAQILLTQQGYPDCTIVREFQDGKLLPPQIMVEGKRLLECDVSLSHDGRYGAVAIGIR